MIENSTTLCACRRPVVPRSGMMSSLQSLIFVRRDTAPPFERLRTDAGHRTGVRRFTALRHHPR